MPSVRVTPRRPWSASHRMGSARHLGQGTHAIAQVRAGFVHGFSSAVSLDRCGLEAGDGQTLNDLPPDLTPPFKRDLPALAAQR